MQIIKSLLLAGLLMFGGYANAQVPVTVTSDLPAVTMTCPHRPYQ